MACPGSQTHDSYQLVQHLLMCGDVVGWEVIVKELYVVE